MNEKAKLEAVSKTEKYSYEDVAFKEGDHFVDRSEGLRDATREQEIRDKVAAKTILKSISNIPEQGSRGIFLSGDKFDPYEEIKKIRHGLKEERQEKLEDFKRKLAYQKQGIAKMQDYLYQVIEGKIDHDKKTTTAELVKMADHFALCDDQKHAFDVAYQICKKRHDGIARRLSGYVDGRGEIDGRGFYENVFGKKPRGKVEVEVRPITVHFKLYNIEDYAYIDSFAYKTKGKVEGKEIMKARRSSGKKLNNSGIPGLEQVITLENASDYSGWNDRENSERILTHEDRHNLNDVIERALWYAYDNQDSNNEDDERKDDNCERDFEIESMIKDEICAYVKDGSPAGRIWDMILKKDTLYGYGKDFRKEKKREGEEFSQEYINLIEKGIVAMFDLIEDGYSKEEAIALLFSERLLLWPRVVERQLGKKKSGKQELNDRKKLNPIIKKIDRYIYEKIMKLFGF